MLELLLAAVVVTGLMALSFLPQLFTLDRLIHTSLTLMAVGLGAGLPIAGYYHMKLFSLLKKHSVPNTRWWIDPRPLHQHLPKPERNRLFRLFFLGASCFGACVAGALVLIALLLANPTQS